MGIKLLIFLGLPVCLALSFLFSGMEAGVFALSRLRIRQKSRAGNPSARVLHQFLEKPENFLWTIVVGNTLVNFVVVGCLFSVLYGNAWLPPVPFVIVFSLALFGFYTFFDLLPKMVFRKFPNRLCLAMARPFRLWHIGLRPVVAVVEWCARLLLVWFGGRRFSGHLFGNREELRQVVQEAGPAFTSEERAMITRVIDLENVTVRQITRPLAETVMISIDTPLSEAVKVLRESGLTRLPVWQERNGVRRIVGVLTAETILYGSKPLGSGQAGDVITPGVFLQEDLRLHAALERVQRSGQRLAVVLGRDGIETGIVSLEDILKTIFGEVRL